jgi:hypothetical protein
MSGTLVGGLWRVVLGGGAGISVRGTWRSSDRSVPFLESLLRWVASSYGHGRKQNISLAKGRRRLGHGVTRMSHNGRASWRQLIRTYVVCCTVGSMSKETD